MTTHTCPDDGPCFDCGALDLPAIGRKIVYLNHHDRPALIRILSGTLPQFWPLLARAYCMAVGCTEHGQAVSEPGVLFIWGQLVKEGR